MKLIKGPRWVSGGLWRRFDWSYRYAGRAGFTALMDIDPSASNCLTSKIRSGPSRSNPKLKREKQWSTEDVCSEGLRKRLRGGTSKWSGAPRLLTAEGFYPRIKKVDYVVFGQVLSTRKWRPKLKVCTLITSQQLRWRFPKKNSKKKKKNFYLCPNTSGRCKNAAGRRELHRDCWCTRNSPAATGSFSFISGRMCLQRSHSPGEHLFIKLHWILIPVRVMMHVTAVHCAQQLWSDAFFMFTVF